MTLDIDSGFMRELLSDITDEERRRKPEDTPTPKPESKDQVFKTSSWSRYQWDKHIDDSIDAHDIVKRGEQKVPTFNSFAREMFGRLFTKGAEKLESIKPENKWAVDAHHEIGRMPEFQRMADRCYGDRFLSGTANAAFCDKVRGGLPDKKLPDPDKLRDEVKQMQEDMKQAQQNGEDTSQLQKQIKKLQKQGKQAVEQCQQFADSVKGSKMRNLIRAATAAADQAVGEATAAIAAFNGWGTGQGSPTETPLPQKIEIMRKVAANPKLLKLIKEAGRMRNLAAKKQRSKANKSRNEISDIELGRDLARLLPSEVSKLLHPATKLDFMRRYTEGTLLQYKLTGKEKESRGPIVVCLDSSGSMAGEKETWAKAVALGLTQVAAMQKRKVRVIHYDGEVRRVDDWNPGKADPIAILESMAAFFGGGTNFEKPLDAALNAIQTEKDLNKADVVFITDGAADVSDGFMERWSKEKKRSEFTCYGIRVTGRNADTGAIGKFCDKTLAININNPNAAEDLVLEI